MSVVDTSSAEFFEAKYRQKPDPWDFATSPYELNRYNATVAAISRRRYKRAFEPGCSVGVLTQRLAGICDAVEAIDFSPTAVVSARERCAHLHNVQVVCASLGRCGPIQVCDLIVLSEVGYYFSPQEWARTIDGLLLFLKPGGTVVATHWLGSSVDHQISGDQVHQVVHANPMLSLQLSERYEAFRVDRWIRA
jgi:SAM-dependent methyltransferase